MKRNVYVCAAASAVLILAGPVTAAAAPSADTARTLPAAAAARVDVTAEGAAAAALKHTPGVVESLDKDGSVWHVDVISKDGKEHVELEVNAASGAVTQRDKDANDNPAEYKTLTGAKVNAEQAMKAALAARPGQVTSVNWEDEDDNAGAPYWEVEIKASGGKTQNVHVDPTTAKVTASSSDDNDNNNDNDDNDDNN
ncbi:PepSY domain-containing protein [Streptomyces xanthophaeus]